MGKQLRLFVLAGEASGDRIGADLVRRLRGRTGVTVAGVGGAELEAEGLASMFPMSDLSVMGWSDVLVRLPLLLWRARRIFGPLERMDATMAAVEAGDVSARVGQVPGRDEVARLAEHFDALLDTLHERNAELSRLNTELDFKVIERTRELALALEDLRAAQKQLVRSEKLAAIGQLTAGVAHEINNPIAVMQGNLDLLREELGAAAAPVGNELRLLDEQIHRIRVIVTKLLQFARPDEFAGYVETVDANAAVADCLVLVRHELKKGDIEVVQELRATGPVRLNRPKSSAAVTSAPLASVWA